MPSYLENEAEAVLLLKTRKERRKCGEDWMWYIGNS